MLKPHEGVTTNNIEKIGPYEKDEVGILEGVIEHMFPNTCLVRLILENGIEQIVETGEVGNFEIEVGVLQDNTSAVIEAYCGKWSDSSTSLEIGLVLIGADDFDGDGINDEFDLCPEGNNEWYSNTALDFDLDGCRDVDEDQDDDNDGIVDSVDFCSKGAMGWTSTYENENPHHEVTESE